MPTAPLSSPPPTLLAQALVCFTQHGLRTTSTHQLAQAAGLSHGSLYRLIGTKDLLLEAVYAYAIDRLLAPLVAGGGAARPGETLRTQLARWWQLLAEAALAQPAAVAFWRQYRTSCAPLATDPPDLGPFVPFLAHVGPVLAPALAGQQATLATSPTLLAEWLAAQWLAAVEVGLSNRRCQAQPVVRAHLLNQAYAGWWLSTGLPADTPAFPY